MRRYTVGRRTDVRRMADAVAGADLDTRVWIDYATVDDDPDAISVEAGGVYVDVTTVDGKPLTCRWGLCYSTDQGAVYWPVERGQEVVVLQPNGDEGEAPLAYPTAPSEVSAFPLAVNGRTVDGTFPFVKIPGNRDWEIEVGGVVRIQGDASAPRAAREGDPVRVTIPAGTFLTAAQNGVLNPNPVDVDGTITGGSDKVKIGG